MDHTVWNSLAPVLAVLGPLIGIPLTLITFYLRALREQQVAWHADLSRRLAALENAIADLRRQIDAFERDYTTKDEWLRECAHARRILEHLSERTARLAVLIPASRRHNLGVRLPQRGVARTERTRPRKRRRSPRPGRTP